MMLILKIICGFRSLLLKESGLVRRQSNASYTVTLKAESCAPSPLLSVQWEAGVAVQSRGRLPFGNRPMKALSGRLQEK